MQACPAALYYMYKIVEHCKYDDLFWNGKGKNRKLLINNNLFAFLQIKFA